MTVTFSYDLDDLYDVSKRSAYTSKKIRQRMVYEFFSGGFVAALITYVAARVEDRARLLITASGFVVGGLLTAFLFLRRIVQYRRKMTTRSLMSDGPFQCTVTIDEGGMTVTQPGGADIFKWSQLRRVVDSADDLHVYDADGLTAVIRGRAFSSVSERRLFADEMRTYIHRARRGGGWGRDTTPTTNP
jgi:hypothetical protein